MDLLQAHAQLLALPDWPVYGLADPDRPGFLAGATEDGSTLRRIRFDHRPPGGTERLVVQTQPGTAHPDLATVLARLRSPDDDGSPLPTLARAEPATAVHPRPPAGPDRPPLTVEPALATDELPVDGRPVDAAVRRESDAVAWSVLISGVVVVIAGWNVALDRPALVPVADLGPYRRQRAVEVEQYLAGRGRGPG